MESSYVSEFADERKTFDRLLDSHFRRLEEKAGAWEQERGILQNDIDKKNDELRKKDRKIVQLEGKIRNTSSTGLEEVVREKEMELDGKRGKIRELEKALREAQSIITELREEEENRRRRALRPTADRSRENKENILDGAPKVLASNVTPPVKPSGHQPAVVSVGIQSDEPSHAQKHDKPAELQEWKERAKVAEENVEAVNNALEKLKEKHRKEQEKWKKWVQEDNQRRANKIRRVACSSEAPRSSPPRMSRISKVGPASDAESTCSGGLSLTNPTVPSKPHEKILGSDGKIDKRTPHPTPDRSSSPPETAMEGGPMLPPSMSRPSTRTLTGDDPDDDASTEGSEAYDKEGSPTPKAKKYIKPDPSRSPKTPSDTRRRIITGTGDRDTPLVIKSEPNSEDSPGPGYYLFDEDNDDLDLDDVPVQRQCGRKRKSQSQAKKPFPKKASPKKPKAKAPLTVREEDAENAPLVPAPQRQPEERVTIFEDQDDKPQPSRGAIISRRRNAGNLTKTPTGPFTISTGKPKRKRDTHDAIAQIPEDSTDASGDSYHQHNSPPDIVTSAKLDDLLSTPAPKPFNLTHLKNQLHPASEPPPKKRAVFTGDGVTPSTSITPTGSSRTIKCEPKTDPTKPKKSLPELISLGTSGYIPAPTPPKRSSPSTSTIPAHSKPTTPKPLTSTDFRLNPLAHSGASFAYSEVVRGKEARKCLPGCTKACCRDLGKFIAAAGLPQQPKGLRWREGEEGGEGGEEGDTQEKVGMFTDLFGKHRDRFGGRERSPLGFWDSEFPDTQKLVAQREDADRREAEKVERRRREAEKGAGGRWVKR